MCVHGRNLKCPVPDLSIHASIYLVGIISEYTHIHYLELNTKIHFNLYVQYVSTLDSFFPDQILNKVIHTYIDIWQAQNWLGKQFIYIQVVERNKKESKSTNECMNERMHVQWTNSILFKSRKSGELIICTLLSFFIIMRRYVIMSNLI